MGDALADAYVKGAMAAGHEVRRIEVAELDFPFVRSQAEWSKRPLPESLRETQAAIAWADLILPVFPLWLGTLPRGASVSPKGIGRENGEIGGHDGNACVLVSLFFRVHGVREIERSILGFCGVKPVRETFIGLVESHEGRAREKWLDKLTAMGHVGNQERGTGQYLRRVVQSLRGFPGNDPVFSGMSTREQTTIYLMPDATGRVLPRHGIVDVMGSVLGAAYVAIVAVTFPVRWNFTPQPFIRSL